LDSVETAEPIGFCLLNAHQSAYCKNQLDIHGHDHLINAVGSQKVSCLCVLDVSAAFDTIDHNSLITRLSSLL